MCWLIRVSMLFSAALAMVLLTPSLPSFPPAEAIRSTFQPRPFPAAGGLSFRQAPPFHNASQCGGGGGREASGSVCDPSLVRSIFPELNFKVYFFDPDRVRRLISTSVRQALEQPLNYARNYLAGMLEPCVRRVIYLDSDLVVVDDIRKLWETDLAGETIGAPEYCHANFTKYFTARFWSEERFHRTFAGRRPCYFNTGVMVMDLARWRRRGYIRLIERWMEVQKSGRIYELGSLPPFLLVFAGKVAPIGHRWNQHGLGGDNVKGSCRELHPGPVSLLHWSGSGKPWVRLDARRPCTLDGLWAPFDLYGGDVAAAA